MKSTNPLTVSFECFPPKTPEGMQALTESAQALAKMNPSFFSVTFGAGGSTREGTAETAKLLQQLTGKTVVPHLSCIGSSRAELVTILDNYQSMGVKRIVALRGDMPSGMGQAGEYRFASDLVTLIREVAGDHFFIDVAAYPEIHPQARSVEDDVLNLKRKFDAGANSAITQYFFNPDAYFYYIEECLRHGITMPVVPGVMPITQFSRLARFSDTCGAEIPMWIRKRLVSYGDDVDSIQAFGLEVVYGLCQKLLDGGVPGLHFYTLNKAETTVKLVQLLGITSVGKEKATQS
jgi:methylenetetrahydrofolate reductase (NADPH)